MARSEWRRRKGQCPVCKKRQWLVGHHLVYKQHVNAQGGDVWDARNCLFVGQECRCHTQHHHATTVSMRMPITLIPEAAWEFATELFGSRARAVGYFQRRYAPPGAHRAKLPPRSSQSDLALSPREARAYVRRQDRSRAE